MNRDYLQHLIKFEQAVEAMIKMARDTDDDYTHDRVYEMEKINEAVADEIRKEANR